MREIIYKGKFIETGEWMSGSLNILDWEGRRIYSIKPFDSPMRSFEVTPDTVCEYTGVNDVDGGKIFENDICLDNIHGRERVIRYENGAWEWEYYDDPTEWKVIGNIHNDPPVNKQTTP